MIRGIKALGGRRGTLVRVAAAVAFVAALIYWEQTAALYVLSTLAMCGLLLVVAFSDLEGRDKELAEEKRQQKTAPAAAGEVTASADPRPEGRPRKRRPVRRLKTTTRRNDVIS